jgi:hypothetical protein
MVSTPTTQTAAEARHGARAGGNCDRSKGDEERRYDAMCRAIDAAYKVDEVKDIRDKAIALEVYAKQARNTEAERQACEIRLRAERKCGQLTAKLEKTKPKPTKQKNPNPRSGNGLKAEALKSAGISPQRAHEWEKLGRIPERILRGLS